MKKLVSLMAITVSLTFTPPVFAKPNAHLVKQVQGGLNYWGFKGIDAKKLDNHQVSQLYLLFNERSRSTVLDGPHYKFQIKKILARGG